MSGCPCTVLHAFCKSADELTLYLLPMKIVVALADLADFKTSYPLFQFNQAPIIPHLNAA